MVNPTKHFSVCMAMPVKMLMAVKHLLTDSICFLINEAFSSGKFSTLLKQATIIPIFKNDDPASVSNYRPISPPSLAQQNIREGNSLPNYYFCKFKFFIFIMSVRV